MGLVWADNRLRADSVEIQDEIAAVAGVFYRKKFDFSERKVSSLIRFHKHGKLVLAMQTNNNVFIR